jgi:hypothetical protein
LGLDPLKLLKADTIIVVKRYILSMKRRINNLAWRYTKTDENRLNVGPGFILESDLGPTADEHEFGRDSENHQQ